jgi:hypothetical protein
MATLNDISKYLPEYEANMIEMDYTKIRHIPTFTGMLYLSGLSAPSGPAAIEEDRLKVDIVISVYEGFIPYDLSKEKQYKYAIHDEIDEPFRPLVEISKLVSASLNNNLKVLVHCTSRGSRRSSRPSTAGMSWSATVVLHYQLNREGYESNEEHVLRGIKFLKEYRKCIFPNSGFIYLTK